jgi:hypothetical protein
LASPGGGDTRTPTKAAAAHAAVVAATVVALGGATIAMFAEHDGKLAEADDDHLIARRRGDVVSSTVRFRHPAHR